MTKEEAVSIIAERIHVTEYVESSYVDCVDIEALRIAIKALEQPEPKRGRWIETDKHDIYYQPGYKCSVCGVLTTCHGGYCPNCGAKMGGEEHETD